MAGLAIAATGMPAEIGMAKTLCSRPARSAQFWPSLHHQVPGASSRLGDRTGGRPTVAGEWADSAGQAAGSHSAGPTINRIGEEAEGKL